MSNTTQTGMDEAARAAASELEDLPAEHVAAVAAWWARHFTAAGHKRLGRVLVKYDKHDNDNRSNKES